MLTNCVKALKNDLESPRLILCGIQEEKVDEQLEEKLALFRKFKDVSFIFVTKENFDVVFKTVILSDILKLKTSWKSMYL